MFRERDFYFQVSLQPMVRIDRSRFYLYNRLQRRAGKLITAKKSVRVTPKNPKRRRQNASLWRHHQWVAGIQIWMPTVGTMYKEPKNHCQNK